MKNKKILVAGICQIGGLSAAIQRFYPTHEVIPVPLNPRALNRNINPERLARRLNRASLVFGNRFVFDYMTDNAIRTDHFTGIPGLYFKAFHPDVISAQIKPSNRRFLRANHSAICLWGYKNGLAPEVTHSLFNKRVFRALGYLNQWESSVLRLKTSFDTEQIDFNKFISSVKREGIFMHTPNHPRISALICLAKLASSKAGLEEPIWHRELLLNDAFSQIESWPVYPDIANEYALHGSYDWFLDQSSFISGLQNFIDHFYQQYKESGVPPKMISMNTIDESKLGEVLSAEIRGQL
jgi:hypothetical protein